MHIPQRGERGFTLIELLIVIAIIGVIAAIAVPVFLNQDDSAEQAALEAELSSAMDLLALGTGLGSPLPSSFPAGQVTTIPGAGSFEPSVTINVDGSGDTLCVDGTTPAGTTISLGLASGLQTSDCATANPNGQSPFQPVTTPGYWGSFGGYGSFGVGVGPVTSTCNESLFWDGYFGVHDGPNTAGVTDDWSTQEQLWSYAIDGGEFQQWKPGSTSMPYGAEPGAFNLGSELCGLTDGQKVQWRSPSGYYTDVITIINP